MEIVLNAPVIIKIIISLSIILIIDRIIHNLILAMLIGTAVLTFWAGHTLQSAAVIVRETIASPDYIILLIMVLLLILLSTQMKETGIMDSLVKSLQQRLSGKSLIAIVPAIIGLIPMPGGALFSAPLVENCDYEKSLDAYTKTKINYWFRHIWEYWFPLYMGVVLALQITGLEIWELAIINLPLTIFTALGGYIILLRKLNIPSQQKSLKKDPLLRYLFPIISVILIYALILIIFPSIKLKSKYLPMGLSILITIIIVQISRPLNFKKWLKMIFSKNIFEMVLLVAVITIYGAFIESRLPDGIYLMDIMRNELASTGIPAFLLIMILPFISGLATGIALGFVGASFPIVVSLLGSDPPLSQLFYAVVLAYASGHTGQLLSPVHVCNIVTNKYFNTNLLKSTTQLIPATLFIFAGAAFSVTIINLVL